MERAGIVLTPHVLHADDSDLCNSSLSAADYLLALGDFPGVILKIGARILAPYAHLYPAAEQ